MLSWLYAAVSIVFIYLRLEQRRWGEWPPRRERLRRGARVLLYVVVNLILVFALIGLGWVPRWAWVGFALAVPHSALGVLAPAVRSRPARIGLEQAAATLVFNTLLGVRYWPALGG